MITYAEFGYLCGNVILPLAMVLYVILHFIDDKHIYLYATFMTVMFFVLPAWLLVVIGWFLIGLDMASKWAKEKQKTSTFIDLKKEN